MKPTKEQSAYIVNQFQKMETKSDFLDLLNYAKKICFGKNYFPFDLLQLNRYINTRTAPKTLWELLNKSKFKTRQDNYTEFKIPKKTGGSRIINAPRPGLKAFQKALNLILQCVHEPHFNAMGFVPGKSIVDNAQVHIGQNFVYNLDLKDFFPSIPQSRIWGRLTVKPFNLGNSKDRKRIAGMIAIICCQKNSEFSNQTFDEGYNTMIKEPIEKWVLPQGAPTSPTLTNAICDRLDLLLTGVSKRFNLNYSRYADDITFSSMHNLYLNSENESEPIYQKGSTFDKEVRRIINQQNFRINEKKVRLQKRGYRQEVTGLIVNQKINVRQTYVKELRSWLYKWERYGYAKTKVFYNAHYKSKNIILNKGVPELAMVLEGKLLYLKMVKGDHDQTYSKLRGRMDKLVRVGEYSVKPAIKEHKTNLVDLIFEVGLEKAMKEYEV